MSTFQNTPTRHPKIVVVGSLNMDLVVRTPRMPELGETLHGDGFMQNAGGKGANQAIAAARQGAQVTMLGAVGKDGFGQQLLQGLANDNVNIAHIKQVDTPTGIASILVNAEGENCIVLAAGANNQLLPQDIQAASSVFEQAQLLLCQCETPFNTIQNAIQLAAKNGVKVIFNPAPAPDYAIPASLLAQVDFLIVNQTEAAAIAKIDPQHYSDAHHFAAFASKQLLKLGAQCVLLTMGKLGVQVTTVDKLGQITSQHLPAISVDVIDTTAAGDTFAGAFAAALTQQQNLLEAVQTAQYCAALTVTKRGAQASIPTLADVARFKQSRQ